MRILTLLFFLATVAFVQAQPPASHNSADIYQGLRRLNVLGSVLYIAAHPDDENTRLLTYLSKDRLYRTGYLSLTRGDGGQNLLGDEQGVALGLIRTQELLAARRIDGAEQFFTRAYDFGFSKNPEETFAHWDREKILSDVVWVIRKFRPDVIITRFPTTGEGGHGHHTASAILANEAFTAAADPERFPEQLKYVQPWQAKRIGWNIFSGGGNPQRAGQLSLDVGGFNAVAGKSYGEIAAESRSQHKSQGFGSAKARGEAFEYFLTTGGTAPGKEIMEDVETSWKRVAGSGKMAQLIQKAINTFNFMQPQQSLPQLVHIYKALKNLPDGYWKDRKLKEVQQLIERASGIWMEAFTTEPYGTQTDSARIGFTVNDRLGNGIRLNRIGMEELDTTLDNLLERNKNFTFQKTIFIPESKAITQPYWLQNKMSKGYFNVSDQQLIGEPDVQPAYRVSFDLTIQGEEFVFAKPVKYKYVDPVKGEIYQPFVVLPPVTFNDMQPFYLKNEKENIIGISVTAHKDLGVPSPAAVSQMYSIRVDTLPLMIGPFSLKKKEVFTASFPLAGLQDKAYRVNVAPNYNSAGSILETIRYDHIPAINYFKDAVIRIKMPDLKIAGSRVGYITGAGDKVPVSLEQMGYEVTILTNKDLAKTNLNQFDAIIMGVRAYNTNSWLPGYYNRLMQYVKEGGNLVVQYNQQGPFSSIGPYPFTISRNRVTDENAPVTLLNPGHQVLNFPNKITAADFTGWVQERSTYHAAGMDKNYETVLAMSDKGEQPDAGSLIIARFDRGTFVYTGLTFFRQLPEGVTGAYRLWANIIALNQKQSF